jgi:hypothetical protein
MTNKQQLPTRNIAKSGEVRNWGVFSPFQLHLGLIAISRNPLHAILPNVASKCKDRDSANMKILLQILLFGLFGNVNCQTISDAINDYIDKEIHKDYKTELRLELADLFQKTDSQFSIDLNYVDTLYIIRGLDIQNRQVYGRLWNGEFVIHYSDSKKWENNKIVNSNLEISKNEKDNVTTNFNPIIKFVENGDFKYLENYANDNSVLSGVNWLIIRLYRTKKDIKIDSNSLVDFDKL